MHHAAPSSVMTESSWSWLDIQAGLPVVDLHGRVLGRVHHVDVDARHVSVRLSRGIARRFDAPARVLVPTDDIVDADDHEVTLNEEAAFILHPEQRPDPHDSAF